MWDIMWDRLASRSDSQLVGCLCEATNRQTITVPQGSARQ
jgi:hypothetical protein